MCKILVSAHAFQPENTFRGWLLRMPILHHFFNTIPVDSEARIFILCRQNYRWSTCSFTKTHHKAVFSPTVVVKYLGQNWLTHSNRSENRNEKETSPPLSWCCAACMYHHWENWWFSNDIPLERVWSLDFCLTPILNNTWYLTEHWKIKHLVSLCHCLPVIKYYMMHLSSSICNPCALTKLVIVSETGAETFELLFLHRQHLPNKSCPLGNTNGWSLRGTLWWPCRNWSFLTLGKTSAASTSNVPDIIRPIFFEASSLFVDFEIPGKEKEGIGHCCIKLIQNMQANGTLRYS